MLAHGVGIDMESVDRFRKITYNQDILFYKKIFSDTEIQYCLSQKASAMHFAARFAAKEAVIKAMGGNIKNLDLSQIEIERDKDGRPILNAKIFPHMIFHLSLSHTQDYAIAIVVAYLKCS